MSRTACPDCGAPIIVTRISRLRESSVVDPDTGATSFGGNTTTTVEDYMFECSQCRFISYQHGLIFAVTDDNRVVPYEFGMWPLPDPQDD